MFMKIHFIIDWFLFNLIIDLIYISGVYLYLCSLDGQASVLKLNLTVCAIMAWFPVKAEKITNTKEKLWQEDVISYMVNHAEKCTGPELSRMLTSVLKRVFFNFPTSGEWLRMNVRKSEFVCVCVREREEKSDVIFSVSKS